MTFNTDLNLFSKYPSNPNFFFLIYVQDIKVESYDSLDLLTSSAPFSFLRAFQNQNQPQMQTTSSMLTPSQSFTNVANFMPSSSATTTSNTAPRIDINNFMLGSTPSLKYPQFMSSHHNISSLSGAATNTMHLDSARWATPTLNINKG